MSDGNTSIDPDERSYLIPDLLNQQELNEWERQNILDAVHWSESRGSTMRDPLEERYVRELHQRMFDKTWKWAGTYRTTEKNIGVAPHQIREELAKLLADVRYWIKNESYGIDEIASRLHHKLVWIHPFPNGNGRHARLMTDLVLERLGVAPFTWGSADLIASGNARERYIASLRAADKGDIGLLLAFVRT
jgi:Fic-DOC domain mobile mystery protein B